MKWEGLDLGALSVAAASRDLRAPLVRLRQLSFELAEGDSIKSGESAVLEQMQLTLNEALQVVDQLAQAASPLEDNLRLEPIQLCGLVQEVSRSAQPLSHGLKRPFICELPPHHQQPVAVGNYQTLREILMRFLTDALRYNRSECPVKVAVQTTTKDEVKVAIRDYGTDFDGRRDASLLNPGNLIGELNPIHARPLMGSLNLLLADKLTQAMHGHVEMHRHQQGGVTIETYLPLSRQMSLLEAL